MLGLLGDILQGAKIINNVRPLSTKERLFKDGSETFKYTCDAISASSKETVSIQKEFPKARYWLPLDSFEIINNSGCEIAFYLNPKESYNVPSYMIKPIARRPLHGFIIENLSSTTGISAGEIIIHMRRLAPDVQRTVNVG